MAGAPHPRATLCLIVKAPRRGTAKTRLAAHIGEEAAIELARAFITDAAELALRLEDTDAVLVLEGSPSDLPVAARHLRLWPQAAGDLGARMEACALRALSETSMVLLIGSDSPGLPLDRLRAARGFLRDHDAVIGPADDGGFYLLGLRKCAPGLLADIAWSASDTLQKTQQRLRQRGLSVALLEPWFDIDYVADLRRFAALSAGQRFGARATALVLQRLGMLGPQDEER